MNFRFGLLILFISFSFVLKAQDYQKAIKKAEKNFEYGHYAKAIPFFKEALAVKTNANWMRKLADCYRLTNQIEEASDTYEMLLSSSKRIRPKVYLNYGSVLISQGNYTKAKQMLNEYLNKESDDEEIKKLIKNLDHLKNIPSMYSDVELTAFNHNTDADEHGAVFLDDGIVFVSDRERGIALFKEQNKTTGREYLSLYSAPRTDRMEYGEPMLMPRKINRLNKNTGPASFSKDGKLMVFSQNNSFENQKGVHTLQLYIAVREDGSWKNISKLPFCNDNLNYMHPALSPDGKSLFFVSDKARGEGGTDIYVSTLTKGKWSRPENLGPMINTEANEGFPYFHHDGRLFFCSKGHISFGGYDIFYSEQDENGNWSESRNLGQPINSPSDDISFCLNQEGNYGLFTSSREKGNDDIFLFRFKEDNMIVSLNIMDEINGEALQDATIKVIATDGSSDTSSIDLTSDKAEIILERDKAYDIIIMKEGFEQFTQKVNPAEIQETFLKLGAGLTKEETPE